ncbi:MAG: hypothetical protein LBL95_05645, partial [Deltaproteobacteria bacterium]|nr:hypothetical protein [Deltaproteobacteria bacterium]
PMDPFPAGTPITSTPPASSLASSPGRRRGDRAGPFLPGFVLARRGGVSFPARARRPRPMPFLKFNAGQYQFPHLNEPFCLELARRAGPAGPRVQAGGLRRERRPPERDDLVRGDGYRLTVAPGQEPMSIRVYLRAQRLAWSLAGPGRGQAVLGAGDGRPGQGPHLGDLDRHFQGLYGGISFTGGRGRFWPETPLDRGGRPLPGRGRP